jgi:hypothetical protein
VVSISFAEMKMRQLSRLLGIVAVLCRLMTLRQYLNRRNRRPKVLVVVQSLPGLEFGR